MSEHLQGAELDAFEVTPASNAADRLIPVDRLRNEVARLRTWISGGILAMLDQGLISGSNFVVGVALARGGGPESYGAYMVAFGAFLLIANVYQALLLEPSVVLAFSLFPENNGRYLLVLLRLHAIFTLGFVVLAGTVLALAGRLNIAPALSSAMAGLLLSTPCVLLFWLARCFAYLEFSPGKALVGSFTYAVTMSVGLALALKLGVTPLRAFACAACGALAGSAFLLLRYRNTRRTAQLEPSTRDVWMRHFRYGRWGLGTVGLSWAQTNSISFTSGYFLGLGGLGGLNALVGLLLPVLQVLTVATRLALPRMAQRFTLYGFDATRRPVLRVGAALTVMTALYWLVTVIAHKQLLGLVYGSRFLSYAELVPVMSFQLIPWAVITACDMGFSSIQQPQACFPVKLLMVGIAVPVSTAMAWRFGLNGAAIAVPACSCLTALCVSQRLRAVWRRETERAAAKGA